jgi:putative flippase GtrA
MPKVEVLKFGIVGVAATVIHFIFFAILFDFIGLIPTLASGAAALVASVVTFFGQKFWVFQSYGRYGGAAQVARFSLSLGFAAIAHACTVHFFTDWANLDPYVAAIIGLLLVPPISFLINKFWVFG